MALSVSACVVRVRVAARRGVNQWSVRKCGGGGVTVAGRGQVGAHISTHIYTSLDTTCLTEHINNGVWCFLSFPNQC